MQKVFSLNGPCRWLLSRHLLLLIATSNQFCPVLFPVQFFHRAHQKQIRFTSFTEILLSILVALTPMANLIPRTESISLVLVRT